MALAQKRNPKRTTILLVVTSAIVIAAIVVYTVLQPKPTTQPGGLGGLRTGDLSTFTTFGEDLYNASQYQQLRDYLQATPGSSTPSVVPGTRNPNPFQAR